MPVQPKSSSASSEFQSDDDMFRSEDEDAEVRFDEAFDITDFADEPAPMFSNDWVYAEDFCSTDEDEKSVDLIMRDELHNECFMDRCFHDPMSLKNSVTNVNRAYKPKKSKKTKKWTLPLRAHSNPSLTRSGSRMCSKRTPSRRLKTRKTRGEPF